jgi:hypothetical protein
MSTRGTDEWSETYCDRRFHPPYLTGTPYWFFCRLNRATTETATVNSPRGRGRGRRASSIGRARSGCRNGGTRVVKWWRAIRMALHRLRLAVDGRL